MKVELKCRAFGANYGDIVAVGQEYGTKSKKKITKEELESIVKEGHGVIVNEKVLSDSKELQNRLKSTAKELDGVKEELGAKNIEITDLKAQVEELKSAGDGSDEIESLKTENSDLKAQVEAITAEIEKLKKPAAGKGGK